MILITGLGRCGTSILTKYLKEVGFCIGSKQEWYDEIRAGYELNTAALVNFSAWRIYCRKGKPINLDDKVCFKNENDQTILDTYRQIIKEIDQKGRIEVIKDPRFTWHPDIIEAWWEVRKDIKLIICHRDIKSIMKSRNSLPVEFSDPKKRELIQYKEDFANFFTKVLQLGIPYETLFFPNFLRDFKSTWNTLCSIGLEHDLDVGKRVWDILVDQTLLGKT